MTAVLPLSPESVVVLGIAAALFGLMGLSGGSTRRRLIWPTVLLAAACAAGAAALGISRQVWLPCLAAVAAMVAWELLTYRVARSAVLFLLGPAMILACGLHPDAASALPGPRHPAPSAEGRPDVRTVWAVTDAGTPVACEIVTASADVRAMASARETDRLRGYVGSMTLIRTSEAGAESNCHGWVFTGGRAWVGAEDVDRILKENGYVAVSEPRAGDVAIYRDENGTPVHTSLVRSILDDRTVLQESKWSYLGRFIHTADQHLYADHPCTYYRSARDGHCLKGIS